MLFEHFNLVDKVLDYLALLELVKSYPLCYKELKSGFSGLGNMIYFFISLSYYYNSYFVAVYLTNAIC